MFIHHKVKVLHLVAVLTDSRYGYDNDDDDDDG